MVERKYKGGRLLIKTTAPGILRALFVTTVSTAFVGLALMIISGENPLYVLISFTTLESPPLSSVLASLGAFFLALSGMLMISTIVSYTLTLKTTEDLNRKLEGLEAEVRNINLAALEEAARSLEAAVKEAKENVDERIEEGITNLSKSHEEGVKVILKMLEEALVAFDELLKTRTEELKKILQGGVK